MAQMTTFMHLSMFRIISDLLSVDVVKSLNADCFVFREVIHRGSFRRRFIQLHKSACVETSPDLLTCKNILIDAKLSYLFIRRLGGVVGRKGNKGVV